MQVCSLCDAAFKSANQLEIHHRSHLNDQPHQCSVCGKRFAQKSNLNKHEMIHGEPRFGCACCGKKFANKQNMVRHMDVHRSEKQPFVKNIKHREERIHKDLKIPAISTAFFSFQSQSSCTEPSAKSQVPEPDFDLIQKLQDIVNNCLFNTQ
ncbi:C2H2 type domain-containing protein [Hexamita inflata]|uniref:C2H2 type domain-containing protein n=1 Tax=Hexamita inflata TaxID=28002 RepID=A0AA86P6H9_9EUKA|nr:C2H2 type domain-containing protein [Hexamita inflata]